ncbi:MAG: NAD(P)-dependent oxidoreductase [Bacteroidota bacterium]
MTTVQCLWTPSEKLKSFFEDQLSGKTIKLIFPEKGKDNIDLFPEIDKADILLGWRITPENLVKATQCKMMLVPGHGVKKNVDLFKALGIDHKINLVNSHGNALATAQHTLAILFTLSNRTNFYHQLMKNGGWRPTDKTGPTTLIHHKTVGLLGYGAINKRVHQLMQGFDVNFKILKRTLSSDDTKNGFYNSEALHEFLEAVDILIIGIPLTQSTKGLIGKKELKLLGKSSMLVNVSRGSIIKQKALFNALKKRQIAGAAIDVWYEYQPEPDKKGRKYPYKYPFHKLDNLVLSPHRGGSPLENPYRFEDVIDNLIRFAEGRPLKNIINLEREY